MCRMCAQDHCAMVDLMFIILVFITLRNEALRFHALCIFHFQADRVPYERFKLWVLYHQTVTSIIKWLLQEPCVVTLSNDLETPTFYQTLAGVTHCKLPFFFMTGVSWTVHVSSSLYSSYAFYTET